MKKIIYLLLLALVILSVPVLYRDFAMAKKFLGEEVFTHFQAAQNPSNQYHYFLSTVLFLNADIRIASLILGILSGLFLYLALKKIGVSEKTSFYSLIVFILSPSFIYIFSTSASDIFPLFM